MDESKRRGHPRGRKRLSVGISDDDGADEMMEDDGLFFDNVECGG